jgi:DNA polymerase-3 subunit epsilon
MSWLDNLPSSVAFVDVETTGLTEHDRVVSLGVVWLSTASLSTGPLPTSFVHLIFNPGVKCHPAAARVHGYSESFLSHQEVFSERSKFLREYLNCADLIVAHNAQFDLSFINRELRLAGESILDRPVFCTMQGCQSRGMPSAALGRVCEQIGISRAGQHHGALEDSWLAMMIYLWLHDCPVKRPFSDAGQHVSPFNQRNDFGEPVSLAPASNTGLSAAGSTPEAARISALVESVKAAKREGRLVDAEIEFLREIDRQEAEARRTRFGVAPWYYEQLAIIYVKQKRYEDEISILQRYDGQQKAPGAMPVQLRERLEKAVERYGHRISARKHENLPL